MPSFQYQIQYADQPQLMGSKGRFLLLLRDRTGGGSKILENCVS